MVGRISKTETACETLMRRILSGALRPGAHVDANEIAAADGVSPTPVRCALNRLVGAGLLESQSNEGFFVPLCSEQDARDLYDGASALLRLAIARTTARTTARAPSHGATKSNDETDDNDIVAETETAFRAIMALCSNKYLRAAFAGLDTRLRPLRLAESGLIANGRAELRRIRRAYEAINLPELDRALVAYHRRRMRLAPQIIARMRDGDDAFAARSARGEAKPDRAASAEKILK